MRKTYFESNGDAVIALVLSVIIFIVAYSIGYANGSVH